VRENRRKTKRPGRTPDLDMFLREWDTRIDLQSGYGSSHLDGLVAFSKT